MSQPPINNVISSAKDEYTIERELASGAMGITYLVVSQKTKERRILKQLRMDRISDWKAVEIFEREAEVLRQLDHPRIPKYVDYFSDQNRTYFCLVQSFIEGLTLQEMMDTKLSIQANEFKSYFRECLEVLEYLHALVPPVLHTDITPKNIIISHGHAFLVDFGSVKNRMTSETHFPTSDGNVSYISPEQLAGQSDEASDMFSLGMSLIALATHSDPANLPLNEKTGRLDVEKLLTYLPFPTGEVLESMIRPDPKDRLGRAQEALQLLDRKKSVQKKPKNSPDIKEPTPASTKKEPTKIRDQNDEDGTWKYLTSKKGRAFWVAMVAVVIFAAFTLYMSNRSPKESSIASPNVSIMQSIGSKKWTGMINEQPFVLTFVLKNKKWEGEMLYTNLSKPSVKEKLLVDVNSDGTIVLTGYSFQRLAGSGEFTLDTLSGKLSADALTLGGSVKGLDWLTYSNKDITEIDPPLTLIKFEEILLNGKWQNREGGKLVEFKFSGSGNLLKAQFIYGSSQTPLSVQIKEDGTLILKAPDKSTPQGLRSNIFNGQMTRDFKFLHGTQEVVIKQGFTESSNSGTWIVQDYSKK